MSETHDTKPDRHPDVIAWEAWIASPDGKRCLDASILGFDEKLVRYLENRLHYAFFAGCEAVEKRLAHQPNAVKE